MSDFVHYKENDTDVQRHLDENRATFETDCMYLLRLMNMGRRLSSQDVHDMRINDRRLRELESEGKCTKAWKFNEQGKRMYVEYFIEGLRPPTKGQVVAMFVQKELFT
jgi:hypothetical protein